MILGDLIKKYRADNGMSMEQFAQRSGLSKAYVSILERNRNPVNGKPVVPSLETIKAVAQATGQDFNDIIAMLDVNQPVQVSPSIPAGFAPLPKKRRVPRVGQIACGEPILAEENIDGYDEIPDDWGADFTLLCRGDSMEPKIKDGDVVPSAHSLRWKTAKSPPCASARRQRLNAYTATATPSFYKPKTRLSRRWYTAGRRPRISTLKEKPLACAGSCK